MNSTAASKVVEDVMTSIWLGLKSMKSSAEVRG